MFIPRFRNTNITCEVHICQLVHRSTKYPCLESMKRSRREENDSIYHPEIKPRSNPSESGLNIMRKRRMVHSFLLGAPFPFSKSLTFDGTDPSSSVILVGRGGQSAGQWTEPLTLPYRTPSGFFQWIILKKLRKARSRLYRGRCLQVNTK